MMLSKCSHCPLAKWEPERGWARVRDAHLLWGGEGGSLFPPTQALLCFLCARTSLGWGTESGPFLLPLLNHVTAFAIRMYISVKFFPNIEVIMLIFFLVRFVLWDQTTPSNKHSYFHSSSPVFQTIETWSNGFIAFKQLVKIGL